MGDLGVDGMTILKYMLNKYSLSVLTEFICRIESSSGLF
jgi:hypothetical protein